MTASALCADGEEVRLRFCGEKETVALARSLQRETVGLRNGGETLIGGVNPCKGDALCKGDGLPFGCAADGDINGESAVRGKGNRAELEAKAYGDGLPIFGNRERAFETGEQLTDRFGGIVSAFAIVNKERFRIAPTRGGKNVCFSFRSVGGGA